MWWEKPIATAGFVLFLLAAIIIVAVPCRYPTLPSALAWVYDGLSIRHCTRVELLNGWWV